MRTTGNASQRTKNRLREHELVLTEARNSGVFGLNSRASALAECTKCNWRGWLPLDELTIEEDDG